MKCCSKCKEFKEIEEFDRCKSNKDGLQYRCKLCVKVHGKAYRKEWERKNPEKRALHNKKWQSKNPEKAGKYNSNWKKNNPGKWAFIAAKYRASKLKATPIWLTDKHFSEIQNFYEAAVIMTKIFNKKIEVDHIVPLQGKDVCGLHVPWNLQVIEKSQNCSKGNRL